MTTWIFLNSNRLSEINSFPYTEKKGFRGASNFFYYRLKTKIFLGEKISCTEKFSLVRKFFYFNSYCEKSLEDKNFFGVSQNFDKKSFFLCKLSTSLRISLFTKFFSLYIKLPLRIKLKCNSADTIRLNNSWVNLFFIFFFYWWYLKNSCNYFFRWITLVW